MNLLGEYIRELSEKRIRDQKSKRTLYHIGPRPAEPKPMSRAYADTWRRHWLDQDVESGVFFSPNPIDIAQYHGVMGDVYAYKIPEWVIAKAGGIHRYDHGSEVLISEEIWEEAGNEIEFLGKSMTEDAIWEKIESLGSEPARRTAGSRPGWMSDEEWERSQTLGSIQKDISGLRSTKHPENAIRMMTPEERVEVLRSFETIEVPGKKDREIIGMIKNYMNESLVRKYIRKILAENVEEPDITQYVDDLENEIFAFIFTQENYDEFKTLKPGEELSSVLPTDIFEDFKNIKEVHLGILVNDTNAGEVNAIYMCDLDNRSESNLILTIEVPRDYPARDPRQFQDWLSAELSDALSHEIQHSCDSTEMLSQVCVSGEEKWESLENISLYYGCEAEVRGHVAGILGRSRRTEQDPYDLLDYDMQTILMKALQHGYQKNELIPVIQNIYSKWDERLESLL